MASFFFSSSKASSKIALCNRLLKTLMNSTPPPPPTTTTTVGFNHRITIKSLPFCTIPTKPPRPLYECTPALFDEWCKKFEKKYSSEEEKERRYKIFQESCEVINENNSDPDISHTAGLTEFVDMTVEDFVGKYSNSQPLFELKLSKGLRRLAAGPGKVISVDSMEEWNRFFKQMLRSKRLVVLFFTKPWYCKRWSISVANSAKKTPDVVFVKIDAYQLKAVADKYVIDDMPTCVILKKGKEVNRQNLITCAGLSPFQCCCIVTSSHIITPKLYTSNFSVEGSPQRNSGAIHK
ncbi:hypothetical protein ABFS82_14G268800 [Erythranthe guttata]